MNGQFAMESFLFLVCFYLSENLEKYAIFFHSIRKFTETNVYLLWIKGNITGLYQQYISRKFLKQNPQMFRLLNKMISVYTRLCGLYHCSAVKTFFI